MHRFKMDLTNPNNTPSRNYNPINIISQANIGSIAKPVVKMPTALNAPMIDRVYKARPGCSACGKKVA